LSLVIAPTAEAVAAPLLEDNTAILDVPGRPDVLAEGWKDSYSVGDSCYCITTFDHNIGEWRCPRVSLFFSRRDGGLLTLPATIRRTR
jgi:hypothetical protein